MNLTNPTELRSLLERHGLSPTKKWGQHFLVSERVVMAILRVVPEDINGILEVGPGPGVLTSPLSRRAPTIALEIDPIAVSALKESAPVADVRQLDALRVDLAAILRELPEPRMIVSNMPYNITGPLLTAFTKVRHVVSGTIVMMQREVAERILARPGQREMGSLSIMLQSRFTIRKIADAPAGAFFPPPKVDSVVLSLAPIDSGWTSEFDQLHEKVVRSGFAQPRKTLANNLKSYDLDPSSFGWSATIRPHQLTLEDWFVVADAVHKGDV